MPTFNGVDIFGAASVFNHDERPNAEQVNHYPGVLGDERLDLGPTATFTTVRGVYAGAAPSDVGAAFTALASIKRPGAVGVLVDSEGVTWTDAILHTYRSTSRLVWAPGWGWTREYEMIFRHLGTG